MTYLVLSCSLDRVSRSRRLAGLAEALLEEAGAEVQSIDLRELDLPAFDNDRVFASPAYAAVHAAIEEAEGVVIAAPVYNWALGSAAKALVEATGATGEDGRRSAWFDKVVTLLCSGGLTHGYMASSAFAAGLMLDFKCIINPYTVYATAEDWPPDGAPADPLEARMRKTLLVKRELVEGLAGRTYRSDWEV